MKSWPPWLLLGLILGHAAMAQPQAAPRRSVSYSAWLLEDDAVTARLVLPAAEAASLVGKSMPLLSTENLARYVLGHVSVSSDDAPCAPADQGYDIGKINPLSLGPGLYGFEIIFRCPTAGSLSLRNALLFDEASQHIDFARIERGAAHATQLFTAARQVLPIAESGALPAAGADRFMVLGGSHVWRAVEWLCAILGFFLLTRTRRQLAEVFAALALGYAASFCLVACGLIADVELLNSGMGFVVAGVAAVMVRRSLRPEPVAGASAGGGSLPLVVLPALGGLFDGLVLPGDYSRLHQWGELSAVNLAAFAAGSLLIEAVLLVACAAVAAFATGRARRHHVRTDVLAPVAGDIAAAAFAGLGSFWLLSRLH